MTSDEIRMTKRGATNRGTLSPLASVLRGGVGSEGAPGVVRLGISWRLLCGGHFRAVKRQLHRAPHPQPLSPEYQGAGSSFLRLFSGF